MIRVAASRMGKGVRKVNKVNKANKARDVMGAKGSTLILASPDSKTANIKLVISRRSRARGHPIVARSWVIRMPLSVL